MSSAMQPHGKGCVPVTSGPCKTAHKPKAESAAAIVEDRTSIQNFLFITFQK